MKEIRPGTWRTRDGGTAVVTRCRASNKLHTMVQGRAASGTATEWVGSIPGHMTATWWFEDGRHNLYRNHDLIEPMESP